eukprot:3018518-Amphidinium_carterae.1
MGGLCFLITTNGNFLCEGSNCGLKILRKGLLLPLLQFRRLLRIYKKELIQDGDRFSKACLAPVQAVARPAQQRRVPACSVFTCQTKRASPCQHFCKGWWCNKHCYKIQLTDGRPIA